MDFTVLITGVFLFVLFCRTYQTPFEQQIDEDDRREFEAMGIDINLIHGKAIINYRNLLQPTKRDTSQTLHIQYHFFNGTIVDLTLKKRSNILATTSTPVMWLDGERLHRRKEYNCEAMANVGDFSFYQDYDHKAAVVFFQKDTTVHGYYHKYTLIGRPKYMGDTYLSYYLIYNAEFDFIIETSLPKVSPTIPLSYLNQPSDTVYPQLLVIMTRSYIDKGITTTIRNALAYWNAVDMIFSALDNPKISINIAAILLPKNDNTIPWVLQRLPNGYLHGEDALNEVRRFSVYTNDLFRDYNFDLIIGMAPAAIGLDGKVLGQAYLNVKCSDRFHRAAIIYESTNYLVGAHELTHLFSADHDEIEGCSLTRGVMSSGYSGNPENFRWSSCSKSAISRYFRSSGIRCYDNYPDLNPTCPPTPIPVPPTVCAKAAITVCRSIGYNRVDRIDPDCVGRYIHCDTPFWLRISKNDDMWGPDGTECERSTDGKITKVNSLS